MNSTPDLFAEVEQVAATSNCDSADASMQVMCIRTLEMTKAVPPGLRPALVDSASRWLVGNETPSLEPARVACWQFLEGKNGNSTTINDREDVAVRALICVLCDEPDDDLDMSIDFFESLLTKLQMLPSE